MSKELAKYGVKTVTNLETAEELPVAAQPAIKTGPACSVILRRQESRSWRRDQKNPRIAAVDDRVRLNATIDEAKRRWATEPYAKQRRLERPK